MVREATECLLDEARLSAFRRAIDSTVKPGDVVLCCGTGNGIFAILAALAGAEMVYGIEIDHNVYKSVCRDVYKYGPNNIEIINNDRDFDGFVNVVIVDFVDNLLMTKPQLQCINRLYQNEIITSKTHLIPKKSISLYTPVECDWRWQDVLMPTIIQGNHADQRCRKYLCPESILAETSFFPPISPYLSIINKLPACSNGQINAVRFVTNTWLSDEILLPSMPLIVPTKPCQISVGQFASVYIEYWMGHGADSIEASISL